MFLILIENFDQNSNFQPGLERNRPYKSTNRAHTRRNDFQELRVVLYRFHLKLLQITFFLILIRWFDQKSKSQPRLA